MKNRIAHKKSAIAISAALLVVLGGRGVCQGQQDGGERIYWTEERDLGWIQRADLDGGNVESVLTTDIQTDLQMDPIFLLAVDAWGEKIYWTEHNWSSGKRTFRRADLRGGNVETLLTVTMEGYITALALDPFGGKLYWGEWDRETSIIRRADLNGSNVETLIAGIEDFVSGIVLDGFERFAHSADMEFFYEGEPASKLYWTEAGTGTIRRADPGGSNIETLLTGIGHLGGILLDRSVQNASLRVYRSMYWADLETNTIRRANLDGSNIETLVTGESGSIIAFALKESWGAIYWTEMNWDSFTTILKGADLDGNYVGVVKEIEGRINFALDPISENEGFYFSRWESNTISYGFHDEEPISLGMEGGAGSIAVDTSADMLYWLDKRTRSIRRANLDGTDVESFLTGIENPEGIALDIPGGKVYWTVRGASSRFSDSGMVQRSNLDGSNVEILLAGLRDPDDIALDPVAGMMYLYVRNNGAGIFRANLDGSGGKFVAVGIGTSRIALNIVGGKMYRVNKGAGNGKIWRSDLDGANVEEVVTGLVRIGGIALDVPLPATSTHTARVSRTAVHATVEGDEVGSLTIEFVPTGSRVQADYAWRAVTDEAGRLALDISIRDPAGVSGLYQARARNEKGALVGTWEDIFLEDGQRQILELTLGGGVKVVAIERLGEPNPDPCSNGTAVPYPRINRDLLEDCRAILASRDSWDPGHGNPGWNAATLIDYWPGVEVRDSRVRGIRFGEWVSGWPFPSLSGPSLILS